LRRTSDSGRSSTDSPTTLPRKPLTYGVAHELATALRTWYFDIGGLLMSERTREPYFDLQRALKAVGDARGEDTEFPRPTGDALKQLGSRLRTSTTDDVATRVGPPSRTRSARGSGAAAAPRRSSR